LDWIAALSAKIARIAPASCFQNGVIERLRDRLPDDEVRWRWQGASIPIEIKAALPTSFRRTLWRGSEVRDRSQAKLRGPLRDLKRRK